MKLSEFQHLLDLAEPLTEWNEEVIGIYTFRQTPNCLHYFLFRIWAPFVTRYYLLVLTDIQVIVLPFSEFGSINYDSCFSVDYCDITIKNNNQLMIRLIDTAKTLSLKFPFFENQNHISEFFTILNSQQEALCQ
ncbi:MAG TPA: hypothetical protein PLH64_01070 [Anaerolineaceae bacterium]|jgi:hypothetical protein|nr:hypothetical protein [Anaerolineaceae bacterium]